MTLPALLLVGVGGAGVVATALENGLLVKSATAGVPGVVKLKGSNSRGIWKSSSPLAPRDVICGV